MARVPLLLPLALLALAGCERGPGESALRKQDARDAAEAARLEAETNSLAERRPALARERAALAVPRARLEVRRDARAQGRYHLVLSPGGTQLAFFSGSRPLGVFPVARPAADAVPPPPPGRYALARMEILLPPGGGEPPNLPGRPKTAGGLSRLVFGDGAREWFYLATKSAPRKPPPPHLPAWLVTAGELDGLSLAMKPGDPLFVTAPEDPF